VDLELRKRTALLSPRVIVENYLRGTSEGKSADQNKFHELKRAAKLWMTRSQKSTSELSCRRRKREGQLHKSMGPNYPEEIVPPGKAVDQGSLKGGKGWGWYKAAEQGFDFRNAFRGGGVKKKPVTHGGGGRIVINHLPARYRHNSCKKGKRKGRHRRKLNHRQAPQN